MLSKTPMTAHSVTDANFIPMNWGPSSSGSAIRAAVRGESCSNMSDPVVIIYLERDPSVQFRMKLIVDSYYNSPATCRETAYESKWTRFDYITCQTWIYEIDPIAMNMPVGTYRLVHGGSTDVNGFVSPLIETKWLRSEIEEDKYVLKKVSDPPGTTSPPQPPANRPEVLNDGLIARVWNSKSASISYSATVRCSAVCGTLPENFAAKLCEVGTSYMSPTCIASARPFRIGKAKKTKLGVVNTFTGTFIVEKKTTGKKYQVYLNIPAGKKQPTTLGLDNFIWNGQSSFKNVPSSIVAPTTNTAPGATTTTIAGTSPSTTSNVASSAALTVTSDSISGKTSLTVKGSGAAVTIDATIKCSGQCTKLPASILGRLCRVGTSYTDASCTSIITLYPASGATATSATFRGNTTFGTSPTGAVYQPFFSMVASGISTRTSLSGTSRVTWTK